MALPSSGQISIDDILDEMGDTSKSNEGLLALNQAWHDQTNRAVFEPDTNIALSRWYGQSWVIFNIKTFRNGWNYLSTTSTSGGWNYKFVRFFDLVWSNSVQYLWNSSRSQTTTSNTYLRSANCSTLYDISTLSSVGSNILGPLQWSSSGTYVPQSFLYAGPNYDKLLIMYYNSSSTTFAWRGWNLSGSYSLSGITPSNHSSDFTTAAAGVVIISGGYAKSGTKLWWIGVDNASRYYFRWVTLSTAYNLDTAGAVTTKAVYRQSSSSSIAPNTRYSGSNAYMTSDEKYIIADNIIIGDPTGATINFTTSQDLMPVGEGWFYTYDFWEDKRISLRGDSGSALSQYNYLEITGNMDDISNTQTAVTGYVIDGILKVSTTDRPLRGFAFGNNGTYLYYLAGGSTLYRCTLTTPYDLNTGGTYNQSVAFNSNRYGFMINPSGNRIWTIEDGGQNGIKEYTFSTAWNITSTMTYVGSKTVKDVGNPRGFGFHPTGTHWWITDINSNTNVYTYSTSTSWQVIGKTLTRRYNLQAVNTVPDYYGVSGSSNVGVYISYGDGDTTSNDLRVYLNPYVAGSDNAYKSIAGGSVTRDTTIELQRLTGLGSSVQFMYADPAGNYLYIGVAYDTSNEGIGVFDNNFIMRLNFKEDE